MSAASSCGCGCGTLSCGCCAGVEPLTPKETANRPGLPALSYRVGTHGSFLETMQARLSMHELPGGIAYDGGLKDPSRPLAALTTREASDPSVALLDAWATVGDVLTFYQERIANEGYLRTATEMRSVYEMARLVGYRPRPGVSASVYLAYTVDENTKEEVVVPKGARAQSVPGPGELPQSFETGEELKARSRWNDLRLRLRQPQRLTLIEGRKSLFLKGLTTGVSAGDPLLVIENGEQKLFRAVEVIPERDRDHTLVKLQPWQPPAANQSPGNGDALKRLLALLERAPTGQNADKIVALVKQAIKSRVGASDEFLPAEVVKETIERIDEILRQVPGNPSRLLDWARLLKEALGQAARSAGGDAGGAPAPAASGPPPQLAVSTLVSRLVRPGSKPLANALQLSRSLADDFRSTSDSGFKVLGAVAPALREKIGPAVAGQTDSNAVQSLEVYAFRVRAGLFGRNFLRKSELEGQPPNPRIVGEYPIIESNEENEKGHPIATRIAESPQTVFLDAQYDGIVPDSWIIIDSTAVTDIATTESDHPFVHPMAAPVWTRVSSVHGKISRTDYGSQGDSMRIDIAAPWLTIDVALGGEYQPGDQQASADLDYRVIRGTQVFARSEKMELALEPIETEFCGASADAEPAELDGLYSDLEPGRFVIVSGERADLGEAAVVRASEALMIRAVKHDVRYRDQPIPWTDALELADGDFPPKLPDDKPHTFVWFDKPLSYCYRRATVSIRANVVKATHGETRNEVLGNGEGAKALQSFGLKQFPLTQVAAPTVRGIASTLEVFVNDVRWHERDTFVMAQATERIYITRSDEFGKTEVVFGNGLEGARLPTGAQNIKAVYRNGLGKPGNVRAEQISQLSTRPLGIKEVINPLRASGGADHETRDQARRNTPNAVMALDRLVSTRDYADFSRAFAGIGKAASVELPDGFRSVVHVTIAGSDDIPIDTDSDLFINLKRSLNRYGDPFQPVTLATRELLILVISAKVRIHPDYLWEVVAREMRARLFDAFGFERRDLGQGVANSELLAALQSVRGVEYVDLDSFGAVPAMAPDPQAEGGLRPSTPEEIARVVQDIVATTPPATHVVAAMARVAPGGVGILPAQLAILLPDAPDTLVLNQIK